jgi:hypothetical protein
MSVTAGTSSALIARTGMSIDHATGAAADAVAVH